MGYTTEFEGAFFLNKVPKKSVIKALHAISAKDEYWDPELRSYNQWEYIEITNSIAWDGGEKFSYYAEHLHTIINKVLKPNGLYISGIVNWRGEEFGDMGCFIVYKNSVKRYSELLKPTRSKPTKSSMIKQLRGEQVTKYSWPKSLLSSSSSSKSSSATSKPKKSTKKSSKTRKWSVSFAKSEMKRLGMSIPSDLSENTLQKYARKIRKKIRDSKK